MGIGGAHGAGGAMGCKPGGRPISSDPGSDWSSPAHCNVGIDVDWGGRMGRRWAERRLDPRYVEGALEEVRGFARGSTLAS